MLLAACTTYAHPSRHNAPGTTDLSKPLPRETGDPARFEPAADPGSEYFDIFAAPFFGGGAGRDDGDAGVFETGIEFLAESRHDGPDEMAASSFGIGAGVSVVRAAGNGPVQVSGPLFAELNYRFAAVVIPMAVGLGPIFTPQDKDFGAQLTYRLVGGVFRLRYTADHGFEFVGGYEIPIPFMFGGSK